MTSYAAELEELAKELKPVHVNLVTRLLWKCYSPNTNHWFLNTDHSVRYAWRRVWGLRYVCNHRGYRIYKHPHHFPYGPLGQLSWGYVCCWRALRGNESIAQFGTMIPEPSITRMVAWIEEHRAHRISRGAGAPLP